MTFRARVNDDQTRATSRKKSAARLPITPKALLKITGAVGGVALFISELQVSCGRLARGGIQS